MEYGVIASKINTLSTEMAQLLNKYETMQLDELWKGSAHNKLTTELKEIIQKYKTELSNIQNFSNTLKLVDKYKNMKEQFTTIQNEYNSVTDEKIKSTYKGKIAELEKELINLKNKIISELNYQGLSTQKVLDNLLPLQNQTGNEIQYSSADVQRILKDAVIIPDPEPIEYIDGKPAGIFKNKAKEQIVYFDGKRLQQDSVLNVKVGETIRIKVVLPKDSGEINLLTRTTASGQDGWDNYIDAYSDPYVNRHDRKTALPIDTFEWVITPTKKSREPVILSQTTFHTTDFSEEVKSMIRVKINIIDEEEI